MKLINVGAAVLNQTPLAWPQNTANIRAAITAARNAGVSVLCLPELCIPGYGCEDAFHSPGLWETSWDVLQELLPETGGMVVSFGLPVYHQNALYDAACLAVDGELLGFVAKRYLAGDGLHYEPRWFKPWPAGVQVALRRDGKSYPFGDIHFDVGGVGIGFEICEDAWVADRPGSRLAARGVDIILNPSASHFAFGKTVIRERFVLEGSRSFSCSYVYANQLGNAAGRAIYDGSAIIASAGKLLAVGQRFSFAETRLISAVVDLNVTRMNQVRLASFSPDLNASSQGVVTSSFSLPAAEPEPASPALPAWETSPHIKEEEFTRAVSLALLDYLRKSRSSGFVVSLSGGADSAATACLVALMVDLGIAELGRDAFIERLGIRGGLPEAETSRDIVQRLLTTVYQATANSGDVTRNAAAEVAEAIGADHMLFDVQPMVTQYVTTISEAIGRELTWQSDDLTLQNIQARVRSPGVWMLANLRNALLLSTSNRSEAAVGYATMDGDTSGGLSPIAGIDKAFLRQWLKWLEETGPTDLSPLPALRAVNVQQPTAELRPPDRKQTDEADLMPYPLLDAIERAAIRDKRTPVEVYRLMRKLFPQFEPPQLAAWVERFFVLWSRNQWKRERYAPSFHVDDENLDPKTWCRFPILSGGFQRELNALREYVQHE